MNLAQTAGGTALSAVGALANSGTMPASPETALSGNTALVTLTFTASAFNAPSYSSPDEQATANFTASSYAPATSGYANFARLFESNGTTAVADLNGGDRRGDPPPAPHHEPEVHDALARRISTDAA